MIQVSGDIAKIDRSFDYRILEKDIMIPERLPNINQSGIDIKKQYESGNHYA
jgi:hypothetical protein